MGDLASIPGLGRSPGGGHGNPLQYSCPKSPMDRGAWWATVPRVTKQSNMTEQLSKAKMLKQLKEDMEKVKKMMYMNDVND